MAGSGRGPTWRPYPRPRGRRRPSCGHSGKGIEHLKDRAYRHQLAALLYAPLPTNAHFGLHRRINSEGYIGLDGIAWRDLLALR